MKFYYVVFLIFAFAFLLFSSVKNFWIENTVSK